MIDNSFSNTNVDFQLDEREYKKFLNLFEVKINDGLQWATLINKDLDLYLIRIYRNRWFFYVRNQKQIIVMEHIIIWDKLHQDGIKLKSISEIYHVDLKILERCLDYYHENQRMINTSRIYL